MPFRAELKRPDLKGQFPCSVCGKIFCHSSSLSRHRMQAHFKSYTCTQCNQEISSNETLRSHMFRVHAISRMFMCRCCNWAFPDKTSLHIHMQSMLRNGQPGEVAVLARSSTEDGSDRGSPSYTGDSLLNVSHSSSSGPSDRPTLPVFPFNSDSIFRNIKKEECSSAPIVSPAQLLHVWLANNQFVSNLANPIANLQQHLLRSMNKEEADSFDSKEDSPVLEDDEEDGYIEINNMKEEEDDGMDVGIVMASDGTDADKRGSHKRKASRPQQLTGDNEMDDEHDTPLPIKVLAVEKESHLLMRGEQLSPTVSDSHTSSGGSHGLDSPPHKCYDCQELKTKLSDTDELLREKTMEIAALNVTVDRLQKQILLLAQTCKRHEMQALQASHLAMLRNNMFGGPQSNLPTPSIPPTLLPSSLPTIPPSPFLSPDVLKRLVDQFVQNNLAQQQQPQSSSSSSSC